MSDGVENGRVLLLEGGSVESVLAALLASTPNAGEMGVARASDYGPVAVYPAKTKAPGLPTYYRFVSLEGLTANPAAFAALLGGPFVTTDKLQPLLRIGGVFENIVRRNIDSADPSVPVSDSEISEVGRITFPDYVNVGDCLDFYYEIYYPGSSNVTAAMAALDSGGDPVDIIHTDGVTVEGGSMCIRGRVNMLSNDTVRVAAELLNGNNVVARFFGEVAADWGPSSPLRLRVTASGDGPIRVADGGFATSTDYMTNVVLNAPYTDRFYARIYRSNDSGFTVKVFATQDARNAGTPTIMQNLSLAPLSYSSPDTITLEATNTSGKSGTFDTPGFAQGDKSPIDLVLVPGGGFITQQTTEYKPGPEHS